MKFIRDIISEKRGVPAARLLAASPTVVSPPEASPPVASLSAPTLTPSEGLAEMSAPVAEQSAPAIRAPDLSQAQVEALDIAEVEPDYVVNLFPESDDDDDGPETGDILFADGWEQDAFDLETSPPAAQVDQEFRTIRAAASEVAVDAGMDQISRRDSLPLDRPAGPVKSKSPFEGMRAPELLRPDMLRKSASMRPTSVLPEMHAPEVHTQEARLRAALAADAAFERDALAATEVEAEDEMAVEMVPALSLRAAVTPDAHRSLSEMPYVSVQPASLPAEAAAPFEVPPPAAGRGANRSGRVKTRLLGFDAESLGFSSPFEKADSRASDPFPVGWLVVVAGPGRGASFALHDGVSRVGRGEDQTVCLNFGDSSISRENHISIAYDSEQSAFYVGQSGRSNIVRLNNKPLLSTEQIRSGDQIRVGETVLRLAALCGGDFSWTANP